MVGFARTTLAVLLFLPVAGPAGSGAGGRAADPGEPVRLRSRTLHAPAERGVAVRALTEDRGRRHAIVQLARTLTDAEREALREAGLRLLAYVPHLGYFATVEGAPPLSSLGLVRAAWRLEPDDRLHERLRSGELPEHAIAGDGRVRVSILAFDDADLQRLVERVKALGGHVDAVSEPFRTVFATLPSDGPRAVAAEDDVQWIEPLAPRPRSEMSRARDFLHVSAVQQAPYGLTGDWVAVSVHELGWAFPHADVSDHVRWEDHPDWPDDPPGPDECDVHATMIAGTVAGAGNVNPDFTGMAPEAEIFSYSFASDPCCEANNFGDIADAVSRGVDVANNSWGYAGCLDLPYGEYTMQARVFDRQVLGRDSTGTPVGSPMTVVFSAGNERFGFFDGDGEMRFDCISDTTAPFENYGTINQPKTAKNVIVVGGIDSANDRMSTFSSWGPTSDGRLRPDLVAAALHDGEDVAGVSDLSNCFGSPSGAPNQQCFRAPDKAVSAYAWLSETSAAAAMVSGIAALFIEDFRENSPGADPRPSTVKAHLIHTARDLNDDTTWYNRGPDYASGYGVVDAQAAIDQERSGGYKEACIADGELDTWYLVVPPNTDALKATLVWDDAIGGISGAGPALVNDLDLSVIAGSQTIRPWILDPADPSAPATRGLDRRNNVEMVEVDRPTAGTYRIRVHGRSVPSGPQCYSLVFSPVVIRDADGDGFDTTVDCDDTRAAIYPGAPQVCDGLNDDCLASSWPTVPADENDDDADGWRDCADCASSDATVYPGAPQLCDGKNNDCSAPGWPAVPASESDADGDGARICSGDCNDTNRHVRPGHAEACDGIDNDCEGGIDEGLDADLDGKLDCFDGCPQVHDPVAAVPSLFMTTATGGQILRVDPITGATTPLVSGLSRPQALAMHPEGKQMLVAESASGELTEVSVSSGATQLRVSGLGAADGVVYGADNTSAFVTEIITGSLWFTNLVTGAKGVYLSGFDGPGALDSAAGVTTLVVAESTGGDLAIVDTLDRTVTPLGASGLSGPIGVTLNAAETMAYVAETSSGELSSVDLSTTTVSTLASGLVQPKGVILSPSETQIYVTERGTSPTAANGRLLSIDLATGAPRTLATGLAFPAGLAIAPASCASNTCNDPDGDGYGSPGVTACPSGPLPDCNNANPGVHPGHVELCNGMDDNCDGTLPGSEADADADGVRACSGDCDDADPTTYPGAPEINDGQDNQCPGGPGHGTVDELSSGIRFDPDDPHTFCWSAQPDATSYEVARSLTPAFDPVCTMFTTSATCLTDSGVPPAGGRYHYLVRPLAPFAGSWGQDSSGQERVGVCVEERSCQDGVDNDRDGAIDCEDSNCLDDAACAAATYQIFDTLADNVASISLRSFFSALASDPADYILFSVSGSSTTDGAWCAERADFYRDTYVTPPLDGVEPSGKWNHWHRSQTGAWTGPVTTAFVNTYGSACVGGTSWCTEDGLGGLRLGVNPAHTSSCEVFDRASGLPPGCSGGAGWVLTVRVGPSRLAACGF